MLSDNDIFYEISDGNISIIPCDFLGKRFKIGPSSIDFTLAYDYAVIDRDDSPTVITKDNPPAYKYFNNKKTKTITIPPLSFILARTSETLCLSKGISAFVEGRSSIGRLGLFVQNAGYVDAGFRGTLTLELFNATNLTIELEVGMRICQIVLFRLNTPSISPYSGKYQDQKFTTGSMINLDKDE